jgi:hypothetical protein
MTHNLLNSTTYSVDVVLYLWFSYTLTSISNLKFQPGDYFGAINYNKLELILSSVDYCFWIGLPSNWGDNLQTKCLLELYGLKVKLILKSIFFSMFSIFRVLFIFAKYMFVLVVGELLMHVDSEAMIYSFYVFTLKCYDRWWWTNGLAIMC